MDAVTGRKIIVADICNTLFDSNTTYDFIRYCIDTGRLPAAYGRKYKLLLSRRLPVFWAVAVAEKLLRKDLFKGYVVGFLKGCSVPQVAAWADSFFDDYLATRIIDKSFSFLNQYDPQEVVLVSSTLQPIAAAIAQKLGFPHYLASELEVINHQYTGRISRELSGKKLDALRRFAKGPVNIEMAITDNFSDKELMQCAREKYAVCYSEKQEQFWSDLPQVTLVRIATKNYRQ